MLRGEKGSIQRIHFDVSALKKCMLTKSSLDSGSWYFRLAAWSRLKTDALRELPGVFVRNFVQLFDLEAPYIPF